MRLNTRIPADTSAPGPGVPGPPASGPPASMSPASAVASLLRGRPLPAAAMIAAAGVWLGYLPLRRPDLLGLQGLGGTSSLLIAASLLAVAGVLACRPRRAQHCGTAALLLGLVSCPMANLGGFLVGMLLAVLGGALAIAWRPPHSAGPPPAHTLT